MLGLGLNAFVNLGATVTTLEIKKCLSVVTKSALDPPIALRLPLSLKCN